MQPQDEPRAAAETTVAGAAPIGHDLIETYSRLIHEFKTPLAALRALAQGLGYEPAIMVDPAARDVAERYIERMVAEIDRLTRLLDSIRFVSKPRHRTAASIELKDLLCGTLHDLFAHRAQSMGISLRIRAIDSAVVSSDRDEILQVLTNLLENALRATPQGGRVTVTLRRTDEGAARVTVEDTGGGISEATLEALRRGEPPPESRGSGIGLMVVRSILARTGGRLAFEPVEPSGTRVRIEWPVE